jgi:ankyrin repeat protein
VHLAVDYRRSDAMFIDVHLSPELSEEVVRVLLKHGADTSIENIRGETPLDLARRKRSQPLIEILNAK